jgi:hypothetical protein
MFFIKKPPCFGWFFPRFLGFLAIYYLIFAAFLAIFATLPTCLVIDLIPFSKSVSPTASIV